VERCRYCDVDFRRKAYAERRVCPRCVSSRELERRQAFASGRMAEFEARWYSEPRDLPERVFEELYGQAKRELGRVFSKSSLARALRR
jgi:hypothetical protein